MNGKELLITGGSGTLANSLVRHIKQHYEPRGIRLFSRSELTQARMEVQLREEGLMENIQFIVGDVQDERKVALAMKGVDIVIHAAAMKRVDTSEKDPLECININIRGSQNVVYCALAEKVERAILISTDKAVYPITLYGGTKLCAESLFRNANVYSGKDGPKFGVIRYGNVFNSNGSVVELFRKMNGQTIPITDKKMTRFWIKKEKVCEFICESIECEKPHKDLFIPHMKSSKITTLAKVVAPHSDWKVIGNRGNEKIHEVIQDGVFSNDERWLMDEKQLREWIDG
jgi:UDP-N-acetylglucosamine 4,6-dehydratase/5-epimerase